MASPSTTAHPIQTLREHVTALEAAITLSLAELKPKHVHHLRSGTRRIEALLALIDILPGLPDHAKSSRKARRALRKLRRAAGEVRDFDVLIELLERQPESDATIEDPVPPTHREAIRLLHHLHKARKREASGLTDVLEMQRTALAPALEAVLHDLKPVHDLSLPAVELAKLTRQLYTDKAPKLEPGETDDDLLHDARKAAKLCRYVAEAAPESAKAVRKVAEEFESIQSSGGDWHDWLTLKNLASRHLGKRSELARIFAGHRDTALAAYQSSLHPKP